MTNDHHIHGDLGDANPGVDSDFTEKHLDDPRINDLPDVIVVMPPEWQTTLEELINGN